MGWIKDKLQLQAAPEGPAVTTNNILDNPEGMAVPEEEGSLWARFDSEVSQRRNVQRGKIAFCFE